MTTNDAVRPVAYWVPNGRPLQDGSYEDGPGYLVDVDDASESEKKHGSPLYPPSAIAHLQARVEALSGVRALAVALADAVDEETNFLATNKFNTTALADEAKQFESRVTERLEQLRAFLTQPEADHG